MTRYTGKDLDIEFIVDGGGTVTFDADRMSLDVTFGSNLADLTAGDDEYVSNEPTTRYARGSLSMKQSFDSDYAEIYDGVKGQLWYYPRGKTDTYPMGGFPAVIKEVQEGNPYADAITTSIQLEGNGGVWGTTVMHPLVHSYSA